MKTIYCYTGSKSSSTYFDAYFLKKYANHFKYCIYTSNKLPRSRNDIVLFTDPSAFCSYAHSFSKFPHKIVCWWHGDKNTPNKGVKERISIAKKHLPKCTSVITSCKQGYNSVLSLGVHPHKITTIPLGVDMNIFRPINKTKSKKSIKVPSDCFCVGSFQRDTDKRGGPKIIKGPDTFISVISRVKEIIPNLFILLSGRRRDYVISNLKKMGVRYKYVYEDNYGKMYRLYNALDCYLMTSRVEGGPKGVIEAPSCNVPVVATDCGMSMDVIKNGVNGYVADIDDVDSLSNYLVNIYNKPLTDIRHTVSEFDYKSSIVPKYEKLISETLK